MSTLDVFDERPGKTAAFRRKLHFDVTATTVAEIIRARVTAECDEAEQPAVVPGAVEETLNGRRPSHGRGIDIEAEVARALNGFGRNQFFMFVNGRQVTSLEERVDLKGPVAATFLRIVPLVGG